jgi:oligopeptide transport system permease protein
LQPEASAVLSYVLRRLASAIPTLLLIVTIAFFMIRLAPGGPFDLERPLDEKIMENLRAIYQLDQPLHQQYLSTYSGACSWRVGCHPAEPRS